MPNINSGTRVDLRDITICAVDSLNPELAARAIDWSCQYCDFGDAILFTHAPAHTEARIIQTHKIESVADYNVFVYQNVIEHISTPFVLVVQWDGFVVNPFAWRPEFRDYDYIGARWLPLPEGESVGNGGFSLRSARLMRLLVSGQYPMTDDFAEDMLIARKYRPSLEIEHGIRYAPEAVADRFAYEGLTDPGMTFGFHGAHNLFRHFGPRQLQAFVEFIDSRTLVSPRIAVLLANYFVSKRDWALKLLYIRMRDAGVLDRLRPVMREAGVSEQMIEDCMRRCEQLSAPVLGH